MHVFITGAAGWVGSAVVNELLDAGHLVTGLARSHEKASTLADLGAHARVDTLDDRELTLPDEDKAGARKIFFAKIKEQLHYTPVQLKVPEYWREKAVFEGNHVEDRLIRRASAKLRRRCWRT